MPTGRILQFNKSEFSGLSKKVQGSFKTIFMHLSYIRNTLATHFFVNTQIIPKLAKVNREAGKRFRQRVQVMRTDFGDFLEHQQGSFKRFTKKWGLLGDLMGNTDDNEGTIIFY